MPIHELTSVKVAQEHDHQQQRRELQVDIKQLSNTHTSLVISCWMSHDSKHSLWRMKDILHIMEQEHNPQAIQHKDKRCSRFKEVLEVRLIDSGSKQSSGHVQHNKPGYKLVNDDEEGP